MYATKRSIYSQGYNDVILMNPRTLRTRQYQKFDVQKTFTGHNHTHTVRKGLYSHTSLIRPPLIRSFSIFDPDFENESTPRSVQLLIVEPRQIVVCNFVS